MKLKIVGIIVIILVLAGSGWVYWKYETTVNAPVCGGIAGKICPVGYECTGMAKYPDAQGVCKKNQINF